MQGSIRPTRSPSNRNIVITVPANNDTGYWVWLDCSWSKTSGLTAISYDHGTVLPDNPPLDEESGDPPPKIYIPLFYWSSTADRVDGFYAQAKRNFRIESYVANVSATSTIFGLRAVSL